MDLKLDHLFREKMAIHIMSQLCNERPNRVNGEDVIDAAPVPIIAPAAAPNPHHLLCPIVGQHIKKKMELSTTTKKTKGS